LELIENAYQKMLFSFSILINLPILENFKAENIDYHFEKSSFFIPEF